MAQKIRQIFRRRSAGIFYHPPSSSVVVPVSATCTVDPVKMAYGTDVSCGRVKSTVPWPSLAWTVDLESAISPCAWEKRRWASRWTSWMSWRTNSDGTNRLCVSFRWVRKFSNLFFHMFRTFLPIDDGMNLSYQVKSFSVSFWVSGNFRHGNGWPGRDVSRGKHKNRRESEKDGGISGNGPGLWGSHSDRLLQAAIDWLIDQIKVDRLIGTRLIDWLIDWSFYSLTWLLVSFLCYPLNAEDNRRTAKNHHGSEEAPQGNRQRTM